VIVEVWDGRAGLEKQKTEQCGIYTIRSQLEDLGEVRFFFFFFPEALHISMAFHRLVTPINSGVERKNDQFFISRTLGFSTFIDINCSQVWP
jgi:hypothetical protein